MYAGDPDFVDEPDETMTDESWLYNECLQDNDWQRTRVIVIQGKFFQHERHPLSIRSGAAYPPWVCQAQRPDKRCQCGLYELMWSSNG